MQVTNLGAPNFTMSESIKIRELTPADAASFWKLRLRGLKEELHAFSRSYEEDKDTQLSTVETRLVSNDDKFVIGAYDKEELICVTGFYRYDGQKVCHKGVVWGVYMLPEYRGKGIAKRVLQTVIEKAKTLPNLELLHLGVNPANKPVVRLYESVGFTKWGCELKALKVNGEYVDEDQMVLFL